MYRCVSSAYDDENRCLVSSWPDWSKLNMYFFVQADKIQDFKQLNSISLQHDKISQKSPRPRRNIWLSRSQSDIFSCKKGGKVNIQDPYYNPPTSPQTSKTHKINPFTAREDLCGGKIKFYDVPSKSVFSLVFDLHSPPGSVFSKQEPSHGAHQEAPHYWQQLPGRRCHSLPVSPQLPRLKLFNPSADAESFNSSASVTSLQLSTLPGESTLTMFSKVNVQQSLSLGTLPFKSLGSPRQFWVFCEKSHFC